MKRETNPIARFYSKPTPLKAVHAKCAECMGCTKSHLEGGFRTSISNCSSYSCPLYEFRPYLSDKKSLSRKIGLP